MLFPVFVLTFVTAAGRRMNLPDDATRKNGLDALLFALNRVPVLRVAQTSPARPTVIQMNEEVPEGRVDESDSGASEQLDLTQGAKVTGKIKGVMEFGVFVDIGVGKDALLHVSQTTEYMEDANDHFKKGDDITAFVLSNDKEKGKISLTMKEGAQKRQYRPPRPKVDVSEFENADEKSFVKGVVRRIADFGAFVELKDGVDGLLHISQLSKDRVESVADVLKLGDEVDVRIVSFENTNKGPRISLSMVPWEENKAKTQRADVPDYSEYQNADKREFITGEVVRVTDFGAFVRLKAGVDGLVHISELAEERVEAVTDVVNVGDLVNVRVIDFDPKRPRISLSMLPFVDYADNADMGEPQVVYETGDDGDVQTVIEVALERMEQKQNLQKEKLVATA